MTIKIYYLFSSITFLQFYIPLAIESKKRGYKNIFILRKNYKEYANPFQQTNKAILEKYLKEYDIKVKFSEDCNLSKIKGVVFMIDGDIYGPPRKQALNECMLFSLDKANTIRFSMTEHMNFWPVYHHFIDHVNYASFSNKNIIDQLSNFDVGNIDLGGTSIDTKKSYQSEKNVFLGNTKLDNIPTGDSIIKKFNLNPNEKYCLFLFPKIRNQINQGSLLNIYSYLRKLGFKIIVKTRPKDPEINLDLRGDFYVNTDIYPNESLELMKVSELCIISSSSANEETIFSGIPCIDLKSDSRPWQRNQYLLDEKTYVQIENNVWKNMTYDSFKQIFENLEFKNSKYFDNIREKYLFTHSNTSEKILNFLEERHKEYF